MPPKTNKRKAAELHTYGVTGTGIAQEQYPLEERLAVRARRRARTISAPRGFDAQQRSGFRNRKAVRGLREEDQMALRTVKGMVDNDASQGIFYPDANGIFNRRKSLKLAGARARAANNPGAATHYERILKQFEYRMKHPAEYKWDDEEKDFVERGPSGDYFWVNDRGSNRREDEDDDPNFYHYPSQSDYHRPVRADHFV